MPSVSISPSATNWSSHITAAESKEFDMNLLIDQMIPYLQANAIRYVHRVPDTTPFRFIGQAHNETYDLYLTLQSIALGQGARGANRGIIVSYCAGCPQAQRAAELIAEHMRTIYPLTNRVRAQGQSDVGELDSTRTMSVLVEIGYLNSVGDLSWIETNLDIIAQQMVQALTDYFGLPFFYPLEETVQGTVVPNNGTVNLRDYPSTGGRILAGIPAGAQVTVYGQWQDWYSVRYEDLLGYLPAASVKV